MKILVRGINFEFSNALFGIPISMLELTFMGRMCVAAVRATDACLQ